MGKIIEKQTITIQITKTQVATILLSQVSPAVLATDIASVSIGGDRSFMDVTLNPITSNGITTVRTFMFTLDDLAQLILLFIEPSIIDGTTIDSVSVNTTNTANIDVLFKPETIAEY